MAPPDEAAQLGPNPYPKKRLISTAGLTNLVEINLFSLSYSADFLLPSLFLFNALIFITLFHVF
jgi:hypothetical protein